MQNLFDKNECTIMLLTVLSDSSPHFDNNILSSLLDLFQSMLEGGNTKV